MALLWQDTPLLVPFGLAAGVLGDVASIRRLQALLDALAPQYHPQPFAGPHPGCMRHLLGLKVYDPYLGLDQLRAGARW